MQNAAEKERRWLLDVTALLLVLVPGVGGLEVDGLAAARPLHVSAPLTVHRRRHNYRMNAKFYHQILISLRCALSRMLPVPVRLQVRSLKKYIIKPVLSEAVSRTMTFWYGSGYGSVPLTTDPNPYKKSSVQKNIFFSS
jgi:hypothetical protein